MEANTERVLCILGLLALVTTSLGTTSADYSTVTSDVISTSVGASVTMDEGMFTTTDSGTTQAKMDTTPIQRTILLHPKGSTPAFQGWPSMTTLTDPTSTRMTRATKRPLGTIACPKCSKQTDKAGTAEVVCRDNPIWCENTRGCWYYTDTDDLVTKGCMDIVPEESGFIPFECSDFYKRGFCARNRCLYCDIFGVGGSPSMHFSWWIILAGYIVFHLHLYLLI